MDELEINYRYSYLNLQHLSTNNYIAEINLDADQRDYNNKQKHIATTKGEV